MLYTEAVWMEYKGRVAYIAITTTYNVAHPLVEERVWGSAGGTEGKLKVRVADLLCLICKWHQLGLCL